MHGTLTTVIAATGLSVSILAGSSIAPATATARAETPEREVAEICQHAEALGRLKEMGRTRADCVGAVMAPADAESIGDIVALCAVEGIRAKVRTANVHHCIERLQELVVIGA